jgi:MYXO-CTERM domain-containing protein
MLLDAKLRAAWAAQAKAGHGPVVGAINLCDDQLNTGNHDRALYMGAEWGKMLQACLVAWAATDKPSYAATALKYFTALLDDLDVLGDGKGGDHAAIRDMGYPIRNLGPYGALAYDWLHDFPGMTPELRARARRRWAAWLKAYQDKGYHPRDPATNYQAGFLIAATMIAIAEGSEAVEESGPEHWKLVADDLWGKDMAAALAAGGSLDGGDWNEGWQYAPLSVAEYALAARVAKAAGLATTGVPAWLGSLLRRHIYALNPSDRLWAGGDFDDVHSYVEPSVLTLDAIALGDAQPQDKKWARGELVRLQLSDRDWLLYDALASIGDPPALVPRTAWPTWYQAPAVGTLYTRTGWDAHAVWFVAACAKTDSLDHRGPNAGNFALSRGEADLIVDPSPYGSLSTLTGNAPTVISKQLPANYQPSQGAWGEDVAWTWATKTQSGVVAARCNYADAYRFQQRKSDVAEALRDFVLLPSRDGHDASLVIIDRATTGEPDRKMLLRFRVPGELAIDKAGVGSETIKDAKLTISGTTNGSAAPALGRTEHKDCFKDNIARGQCDAARFPVTDYRIEIPGPAPRAVHVIEATGTGGGAKHSELSGDGWTGVRVQGTRDAVVIWPAKPGAALSYRAPKPGAGTKLTHVVLDAPATAGKATVTARPDGDACVVTLAAGGTVPALPVIIALDDHCTVTADPEEPHGESAEGKPRAVPVRSKGEVRPSGCCAAQGTPGSPLMLGALVLGLVWRRRRRAPRA